MPYIPGHVPKYHEWMKTDELQELTASEPLTLDEVGLSGLFCYVGVVGEMTCFVHLNRPW